MHADHAHSLSGGEYFIGEDFSRIEGRVPAWLAGEETALDICREGADPYIVNAARISGADCDAIKALEPLLIPREKRSVCALFTDWRESFLRISSVR